MKLARHKPGVLDILVVVLCLLIWGSSFAQNSNSYLFEANNPSKKFQFALIASIYAPAQSQVILGEQNLINLPNYGLSFGFEYDLMPNRKWSIVSGLFVQRQHAHHYFISISPNDLHLSANRNLEMRIKESSFFAFNLPVFITRKVKNSKGRVFELRGGSLLHFSPPSSTSLDFNHGPPEGPYVTHFRKRGYSRNNFLHTAINAGFSTTMVNRNTAIKIVFTYNYFLKDMYYGSFIFENLRQSDNSIGSYRLSGNHLNVGLTFSRHRTKKNYG